MLAVSFSFGIEQAVWVVASIICLLGAVGVVALRNPVHNALSLVATLFGVAVIFIAQGAYFLAAIQVMVYAGAIVVLFLFVIMLLGVDRTEEDIAEQNWWRRPLAGLVGAGLLGGVLIAVLLASNAKTVTGKPSTSGALDPSDDIGTIGRVLFTRYIWAFEITAVLLTVAVIGAVVLARKQTRGPIDLAEFPLDEPEAEEVAL